MNLWQRLEYRGRWECNLDETWHLFSVDLDWDGHYGYAWLKFAQKDGDEFLTDKIYQSSEWYLDLRDKN